MPGEGEARGQMPDRAPFLPPLLSSRPRPVQVGAVVVPPLIGGFLTGATLGWSVGAWVIANVLATLGGFLAGFDHDRFGEAARRGALGGLLFGLALVLADALVVDDRVARIASPPIAAGGGDDDRRDAARDRRDVGPQPDRGARRVSRGGGPRCRGGRRPRRGAVTRARSRRR